MSLLNFPPEVILQFLQKMNVYDRINLSLAHTGLSPLCFDSCSLKLLDRNYMKTITLNELRQLYEESRTENERDQCFKSDILDRLEIKNFNEVVHMYMDLKNEPFLANGKILHSLGGKLFLEKEKFSVAYVEQFLRLLERTEGNLLLGFVDIEQFGAKNAERCARILSSKLKRGQKVYFIEIIVDLEFGSNCAAQIKHCMDNTFTVLYTYNYLMEISKQHSLFIDKRNSLADTKELIGMINDEDPIIEARDHLEDIVPLLEAAELSGGMREIVCRNCLGSQEVTDDELMITVYQPDWFYCRSCKLK